MLQEAAEDADVLDALPPDTPRAIDRLSGSQLGRKDKRLERRSHMPRAHAPKRRTCPGALVTQSQYMNLREVVFERARQLCERCGRHRDATELQAHHRQLLSRGGEDRAANLASLCPECHEWCHRNIKTATGLGYIVPSRADPARRAMQLHDGRLVLLNDAGTYDELAA